MKTIKKVAVTPVQSYTGQIIDSFNTSSDKHTNAPSIDAVEKKIVNTRMMGQDMTKVAPSVDFTDTIINNKLSQLGTLEIVKTAKDGATSRVEYDGSKNVSISLDMSTGMTTVTGNLSVIAEQSAYTKISFPQGYTKDNCVAIAVGHKQSTESGYKYGDAMRSDGYPYSFYVELGAFDDSSKIGIHYFNPEVEVNITVNYKIVLMKI